MMNQAQKRRSILIILILVSLYLLSRQFSKELYLVNNQGIVFKYAWGDTNQYVGNDLVELNCTIINQKKNTVNYLAHSCNGLEFFVVCDPDIYQVDPLIHCNVSYPIIRRLKAGDSLQFTTHLPVREGWEKLKNVGIDFRLVNKFMSLDSIKNHPSLIEDVSEYEVKKGNIIWQR